LKVDKKYYIGFDAGTQSVKVAVYDENLNCVAMDSAMTTLSYPHPGWVEMNVDEYYRLIKKCMKSCCDTLKQKGINPAAVRAIMGDGIICGIAGVDENGNAVTPFINYLDSRTAADVEMLKSRNLKIWAEETGNAEPNCMFPAMFARWFLKNSEAFRQHGVKFMHNCPYILLHLAGLKGKEAFIDWGAMSGWGLGYNVMKKEWSQEQLDILGIDAAYMPRIVKPWDIIGTLCEQDAAETGFPAGIAICAGAGDTMESMMGSGIFTAGRAVDVAGTCAMFCASTKGIIPELSVPGSGLIFNSGTLPDTYFYWGFVRTGGLALRWFKDSICRHEEDEYYGNLDEQARRFPAGCEDALFIPYLTGGNGEFQHVRGTFLGLTLDSDQGALWRCVLEGIGYDYLEITDRYRHAGIELDRLTVTEGGSRDPLWNQIKADMLDTEVVTLEVAGGAVPTNCIVAAFGRGDIADLKAALQRQFKIRQTFKPNAGNTALYRKNYNRRKKILAALNPVSES
jgi:xylulokinase